MVVCSSVYYMRVISYFGSVLVTTLQDPPSPESVQNSNTWHMQSEYFSFAFRTDGACGPCVLALPLGLMAHVVRVS